MLFVHGRNSAPCGRSASSATRGKLMKRGLVVPYQSVESVLEEMEEIWHRWASTGDTSLQALRGPNTKDVRETAKKMRMILRDAASSISDRASASAYFATMHALLGDERKMLLHLQDAIRFDVKLRGRGR